MQYAFNSDVYKLFLKKAGKDTIASYLTESILQHAGHMNFLKFKILLSFL